jgi:hypothetical protein
MFGKYVWIYKQRKTSQARKIAVLRGIFMIASNRTRTGDPFITSIKKIAVFLRFIYKGVALGVSTLEINCLFCITIVI